ncbi:hypothetical protein CCACVL1_03411 [Corchorus capsularis]|uniref:Uncharacterized protein n=1 Tax=Corchorus capsularis TaxID=210143 RepID=A0A1R3JZL3_COCAP|nr:hypothetical protein CCACVL1_03411 [Corchorus capsularis]
MARKGNPILVRLGLNRSSDSSWFKFLIFLGLTYFFVFWGNFELTWKLTPLILLLEESLGFLSSWYMEGETFDVFSSGASSSGPQTDITLPQGPGAEPVLPDLNETSKEQRSEELKIKVQELDLKALAETKEDLRMWMNKLFRSEIERQTGRTPPDDLPIENLGEQVDALRSMYGGARKSTPKGELHVFRQILGRLYGMDLALQEKVKRAVEKAVRESVEEGTINPNEWD